MSLKRTGVFVALAPCGCIRAAVDDDYQEGIEEIRQMGELQWLSDEDYKTTPTIRFRCTHRREVPA